MTKRVLLLTTDRSYRNDAFAAAAARLGIDMVQAVDMTTQLAAHWQVALGVDFDRPDSALETIAEYARRQPFAAVLAVDDSGVMLAAQAAQRLGLPHNDSAAAAAVRDKFRMRTLLHAAGVPCPWFRQFSFQADVKAVAEQAPYPCVVKPVHLNGSRGVMRADNAHQFVAVVERLRRMLHPVAGLGATRMRGPAAGRLTLEDPDDVYLVEAFIPGVEVALEGMLDRGELTTLALFDKPDPLDGPFFEETLYVTPSRLPAEVQAAIDSCVAQAARALGLAMGPVHAELRINDDGPWMLEIAGRSIGGLCGQTLRFDLDMALEELILRQACGLPWRPQQRPGRASGVMMIPIPEAGILIGVNGVDAAKSVAGIDGVEITASLNYVLTPLPEGESYLGFIFASGATPADVEAALRAAHSKLQFDILPEFTLNS